MATVPATGSGTRIAVAGDTGTGPDSAIVDTVDVMAVQGAERRYDALVLLGDLVYPEGDAGQLRSRVVDIFEPITATGTRLVPVLGNHDYLSGEQSTILATLGRSTSWYADQVGTVRILVLDTEQVTNPAQTTWLREALAAPTSAEWTIVAMHKPAYSAGMHGSDAGVQLHWVPLFEQFGVRLVLAGHDHDYQRSKPINGVTYVVSGGAATLRDAGAADFTETSTSTRHYVDLLVVDGRLLVRAIDQSGEVFDSVELGR